MKILSLRERLLECAYPGLYTRGYSIVDGTMHFYRQVGRHVREGCVLLDLGAGRGAGLLQLPPNVRQVALFAPRNVRRIGVDIDPAVSGNPFLAECHVLHVDESGYHLPFSDASVDLVLADWVMEHLVAPEVVFAEVHRVLKPEGIFAFRTINRRHYVAIGALLLESRLMSGFSRWILTALQKQRAQIDVFPKIYCCNTPRQIMHLATASGQWEITLEMAEAEPSYMMSNLICAVLGIAYERLTRRLPLPRSTIIAILTKKCRR
jgi:SAM-dependent methyltransferase